MTGSLPAGRVEWEGQVSDEEPGFRKCSAKGCQAAAVWAVVWNNPRVHTPERRKAWMACDEHRSYLSDFLDRRGFLREVVAVDDAPE